MTRPLRIEFDGALYHLTSRGDGREAVYLDDADREEFLSLLGTVCDRFDWICYAYCLMGNHYHLLAETRSGQLSRGMRHLNGVYTQRFNRRHARVGHVFQGRFHSVIVDKDHYLLAAARYIVLNPVRAGLTDFPGAWRWSSYRATSGDITSPNWLDTRRLLSLFGPDSRQARERYKRFVADADLKESFWGRLHNQIYLGDDTFVRRTQAARKSSTKLPEIPGVQQRLPARPLEEFERAAPDRDCAILSAYDAGGHTQRELARHFGLHHSRISKIIAEHETKETNQT